MYKALFSKKYLLDVALVIEYIASISCNPTVVNRIREEINVKFRQ